MPSATVTRKGQITLPKEIRSALGLHSGSRVLFWGNPHGQVVVDEQHPARGVTGGAAKGRPTEES